MMTQKQKIARLKAMLHHNECVGYLDDTFSVTAYSMSKTIDFTQDMSDVLYQANCFILSVNIQKDLKIQYVGNFGQFYLRKLAEICENNGALNMLDNGEIDVLGTMMTIRVNMFLDLVTIVSQINTTISNINQHRKLKIDKLKLK